MVYNSALTTDLATISEDYCVYQKASPDSITSLGGFPGIHSLNLAEDALLYVDVASGDYRLQRNSLAAWIKPAGTPTYAGSQGLLPLTAFSEIIATPDVASPGTEVSISATASNNFGANPTLTVNSHTATITSHQGNVFTFVYRVQSSDHDGAAMIEIDAENAGSGFSQSALIIKNSPAKAATLNWMWLQ